MKVWSDRLTCIINSYSFGFSKDLRERSNPITVTGKKGGEKSENFGRLTKWGFHSERSVGAVWHGRFDYLSNRIWGSGRHGAVWCDAATESAEAKKTKAHV